MASDIKRMMTVHARSSLQILDSGAGISGVGEQWKMTDISRSSTYSVQGAFGEPMTPTVQGFLRHTWRIIWRITKTHVADQVDGIYVLRPASMTTMAHVHSFSTAHANQEDTSGLYAGYTRPGLH